MKTTSPKTTPFTDACVAFIDSQYGVIIRDPSCAHARKDLNIPANYLDLVRAIAFRLEQGPVSPSMLTHWAKVFSVKVDIFHLTLNTLGASKVALVRMVFRDAAGVELPQGSFADMVRTKSPLLKSTFVSWEKAA